MTRALVALARTCVLDCTPLTVRHLGPQSSCWLSPEPDSPAASLNLELAAQGGESQAAGAPFQVAAYKNAAYITRAATAKRLATRLRQRIVLLRTMNEMASSTHVTLWPQRRRR